MTFNRSATRYRITSMSGVGASPEPCTEQTPRVHDAPEAVETFKISRPGVSRRLHHTMATSKRETEYTRRRLRAARHTTRRSCSSVQSHRRTGREQSRIHGGGGPRGVWTVRSDSKRGVDRLRLLRQSGRRAHLQRHGRAHSRTRQGVRTAPCSATFPHTHRTRPHLLREPSGRSYDCRVESHPARRARRPSFDTVSPQG